MTCREVPPTPMALEDQNQMENVGGRGDVPSCHKVNVFMSRETPAGSPSVVYVVKGGGTCGANRNEVGVMPSPPSLRGRKPSKRFKYVFSSTFPRGSRNGADRARSGGLINLYRGCASGFFASETNHRFLRGQSGSSSSLRVRNCAVTGHNNARALLYRATCH